MRARLVKMELWAVVRDGVVRSSKEASDRALLDKDDKALATIIQYVCDEHLPLVEGCKTSKEAWDKLESTFRAKSAVRRLKLRQELNALRKSPAESLTVYFNRARAIWGELTAMGHIIKETEVVWTVLAGLPSHFNTMVAILMNGDEELELSSVLIRLAGQEQLLDDQEKRPSVGGGDGALLAGVRGGDKRCYSCGEVGHIKKYCPKRGKRGSEQVMHTSIFGVAAL